MLGLNCFKRACHQHAACTRPHQYFVRSDKVESRESGKQNKSGQQLAATSRFAHMSVLLQMRLIAASESSSTRRQVEERREAPLKPLNCLCSRDNPGTTGRGGEESPPPCSIGR